MKQLAQKKKQQQLALQWGHESWLLDCRRALIHPAKKILFLSDLHIGLYATLRAQGGYLPGYDTILLEKQLQSLILDYKTFHWILVGDIKHSHHLWNQLTHEEINHLRNSFSLLTQTRKVTIIIGNHDAGLEEILAQLEFPFDCVSHYQLNQVTVVHKSDLERTTGYSISGHVHPVFSPKQLKTIPIFAVGKNKLILPAFNPVAGGYKIGKVINDNWNCYGIFSKHLMDLGPLQAWQSSTDILDQK